MTTFDLIQTDLERSFYRAACDVPDGTDYDTWRWKLKQAADAILWFLYTGRASYREEKFLERCRFQNLLRHMVLTADSTSTDALLAAMRQYPTYKREFNRGR